MVTLGDLPIDSLLPEICATLETRNRLVLAAPPGAGKTTRVPLALAGLIGGAAGIEGRILVLEPRRLAARMAADRMASTLGERTGGRIGLSTRIERRVSSETVVEVITDGLFTRRLLADPGLDGVGAVLFDEVHERGLNTDLGIALALDSQSALREDLKLVVMSATLDTALMSRVLDAPVIESEGRQYPVDTRYLGRTRDRVEDQMASAIKRALREEDGSILAFLPGAGEIRRTAERLGQLPDNTSVHPLFGALSPAEQDAAVSPTEAGRRKIVLATDIAESSLTIEGVRIVIDSGMARVPEYDPAGGTARLITVRAARANVDQRRGRAGRMGPGVCYRLWDEAETLGLRASPTPEILNSDLSGLLLALAEWGEQDPDRLTWLDNPPAGRIAAARMALLEFGALQADGRLTERGKAMAKLPMAPRLASLIVSARNPGERALAANIAALVSEAGMGGASSDLSDRLAKFQADRGPRAKALQRQARQWGGDATPKGHPGAWPDRLARRRPATPGTYLLASGRAGQVDESGSLAKSDWLVVVDMIGKASGGRITLAAALDEAKVMEVAPPVTREIASFDPTRGVFLSRRVKSIGAIILSESPMPAPSGEAVREAFFDLVATDGFEPFGLNRAVETFLARLHRIRATSGDDWPDWTSEHLNTTARAWLGDSLPVSGKFRIPTAGQVGDALKNALGWPKSREIDDLTPSAFDLPSGRAAPIDYLDANAPLIEVRVQEMYGLSRHPAICSGRVGLTVSLLSPARRPVAVTKDVPGFWSRGYRDMAKDMRSEYPKHDWPEAPASAKPHAGMTKKRLNQS